MIGGAVAGIFRLGAKGDHRDEQHALYQEEDHAADDEQNHEQLIHALGFGRGLGRERQTGTKVVNQLMPMTLTSR